ncbi:MAG: zinc-binding dehydrogenase [Planctomycetota bacterium]|nr:zinc-binding dehydrogenase [Planctomycetota bacterium]
MRAALSTSLSETIVEDLPKPIIGPGEALLRVQACSLGPPEENQFYLNRQSPLVLGRGPVGYLVSVGASVSGFKEGDRVYVPFHIPYRSEGGGSPNHLQARTLSRWTALDPGGFSELVRIPADHFDAGAVCLLPRSLSTLEACFLAPLSQVLQAFQSTHLRAGGRVLVLGLDLRGLLAVQHAVAEGSHVVACDRNKRRRDIAEALGAVPLDPGDSSQNARSLTQGLGVESAVFFNGDTESLGVALNSLSFGGRLIIAGLNEDEKLLGISPRRFLSSDLSIQVSTGTSDSMLAKALELLEKGERDLSQLPLEAVDLHGVAKALRESKENKAWLGTLVFPGGAVKAELLDDDATDIRQIS